MPFYEGTDAIREKSQNFNALCKLSNIQENLREYLPIQEICLVTQSYEDMLVREHHKQDVFSPWYKGVTILKKINQASAKYHSSMDYLNSMVA